VDEKQVIFYSQKYTRKAQADWAEALKKARDLVDNPSKCNKSTSYCATKYVKNLTYDKKTGETLKDSQCVAFWWGETTKKEELDGYDAIAIMTSEYKESMKKLLIFIEGFGKSKRPLK